MRKVIFLVTIWFFSFISFFTRKLCKKSDKHRKAIAYFPCFFKENAGFHWRVEKWSEILKENQINTKIFFALSQKDWVKIKSGNHLVAIKITIRRFFQILKSKRFSTVIVRREILPFNDYGNLFLEKLLIHFHPNAILDIDDDLAASKNQPKKITNWYGRLSLENGNKFNESLKFYSNFLVASKYLKDKVKTVNPKWKKITVIPTCIDYNMYEFKKHKNPVPVIGWIGSDYNYPQLDKLLPILKSISKEYKFKLVVVGGEEYVRDEANFEIEFKKWSLKKEKEYINGFDIGVMPLDNSKQSKGKGGFKLIQYLAMGVTPIASEITINKDILCDERYGFLAKDPEEWRRFLVKALNNENLRKKISKNARKRAIEHYTFVSNKEKYLNAINSAVEYNIN